MADVEVRASISGFDEAQKALSGLSQGMAQTTDTIKKQMSTMAGQAGAIKNVSAATSELGEKLKGTAYIVKLEFKKAFEDALLGVQRNLGAMGSALSSVTEAVVGSKAALIALGGAAVGVLGAGALIKFTSDAINMAASLHVLSQRMGVSASDLSAFKFIAEQSGTSMSSLAIGFKMLNRELAEASRGNKQAYASFRELKVEIFNTDGSLRNAKDVFLDTAEKIANLGNASKKTEFLMRIFGRSGADLLPLMNKGRPGIEQLWKEAEKLGLVISDEAAEAANQFKDNMGALGTASEKLGIIFMNKLVPSLTVITQRMREAMVEGGVLKGVLAGLRELWAEMFFGGAGQATQVEGRAEKALLKAQEDAEKLIAGGMPTTHPRIQGLLAEQRALIVIMQQEEDNARAEKVAKDKAAADENLAAEMEMGRKNDEALNVWYEKHAKKVAQANEEEKQLALDMLDYQISIGEATLEQKIALVDAMLVQTRKGTKEEVALLQERQKAVVALEKIQIDGRKRLAEEEKKRNAELEKSVEQDQKALDSMTRKNDLLEKGIVAVEDMAIAELEAALNREWANDNVDIKVIEALEKRLELTRQIKKEAERGEHIKAIKDEAEAGRKAYEKMADDINRALTDALMRGFESGKDFAKNFKDTLVNMFKTMVLKPIIEFILKPISTSITSILGSLLPGLGGAGGGGGALGALGVAGGLPGVLGGGGVSGVGGGVGSLGTLSSLSSLLSGSSIGRTISDLGMLVTGRNIFPGALGVSNLGFGVAGFGGGLVGGAIGGKTGAMLGSIGGTIGMAIGGPIGGIIGSVGGGLLGKVFGGGSSGPTKIGYRATGAMDMSSITGKGYKLYDTGPKLYTNNILDSWVWGAQPALDAYVKQMQPMVDLLEEAGLATEAASLKTMKIPFDVTIPKIAGGMPPAMLKMVGEAVASISSQVSTVLALDKQKKEQEALAKQESDKDRDILNLKGTLEFLLGQGRTILPGLEVRNMQTGGSFIATSPRLLRVGEMGPERVTVRPMAGGRHGARENAVSLNVNFNAPAFFDNYTMRKFMREQQRMLSALN